MATWGLLLTICCLLTSERRAQVAVVIVAATLAEVTGSLVWGVYTRHDVGGAFGALLLAYFLVRGRAPGVYAGVFLVVAGLELYGTSLGTWTWAETIPGTGIPNGNPPSGVASGYVWFDVMALALAPRLLAVRARLAPARA